MEPLLWLDIPLLIGGGCALAMLVWNRRGKHGKRTPRSKRRLPWIQPLVLSMGLTSLAAAGMDIGLAELEVYHRCENQAPYVDGFEFFDPMQLFEAGTLASDFDLPTLEGGRSIKLSDYRGRKPVLLVFGNFT
jgi:hypothetical protein